MDGEAERAAGRVPRCVRAIVGVVWKEKLILFGSFRELRPGYLRRARSVAREASVGCMIEMNWRYMLTWKST